MIPSQEPGLGSSAVRADLLLRERYKEAEKPETKARKAEKPETMVLKQSNRKRENG